jgi:hypothetical protein
MGIVGVWALSLVIREEERIKERLDEEIWLLEELFEEVEVSE